MRVSSDAGPPQGPWVGAVPPLNLGDLGKNDSANGAGDVHTVGNLYFSIKPDSGNKNI